MGAFIQFDSYIVSDTKTAFSVPVFDKTNIKIKNNKSFKRFAFTLAETLITLTIIGVIAALTVPNLLNKYTKHTYVVGLKKAYSQLQNAMKMIPITEGCSAGDYDCAGINYDSWEGHEKLNLLLSKQFNTQKYCTDTSGDCNFLIGHNSDLGFKTQDGTVFNISTTTIGVDINGDKGPNKFGRDRFYFRIDKTDKSLIIPVGSKLYAEKFEADALYWQAGNVCTSNSVNTNGDGYCAGRVLEEDAMNY